MAAMEPAACDTTGDVNEDDAEVDVVVVPPVSVSAADPAGELGGVKSSSEGSISESESSRPSGPRALPRSLSPLCLEPGEDGERTMEDDAPP
jgi:hypothetical protein